MRALLAIVSFGTSLVASPRAARAEPASAEPIIVAYAADDACPREEAFVTSVRRYTTKWMAVAAGAGLRSFELRLDPRGADYAGTLVITMPDGNVSTRELVGPDCAAVARAIAVMVALAIDPLARIGEAAPGDEDEPEAPTPELTSGPTEPVPPRCPLRLPLLVTKGPGLPGNRWHHLPSDSISPSPSKAGGSSRRR